MPAERTFRLLIIVSGVWLAGVAPTRGQNPDCSVWEEKHPAHAPSPREGHAMAYDDWRHRTILFGGSMGDPVFLGDTWEWDGVDWELAAIDGPSPRFGHDMAFDSDRGVIVLFGGANSALLGDTWEWDGTTWTLRDAHGPPPRSQTALVYDQARRVSVLFGGYGLSGALNDTWNWDGRTWVQRFTQDALVPRYGHAMAYDESRRITLLYGGFGAEARTGTRGWTWNGSVWSPLPGATPGFRADHAMSYAADSRLTFLFGGLTSYFNPIQGDLWEWEWSWSIVRTDRAPPRRGHAMAYDRDRRMLVAFGGVNVAFLNDTWELPTCRRDSDGDGVPDTDDECDNSNLRLTVVIDGCDSGVGNHLFDNGCTMADRIAECARGASNHGAFVGCVGELTNTWVRDEIITPRDKRPIQRCAAQSNLPLDDGEGDDSRDERPMKNKRISREEPQNRP